MTAMTEPTKSATEKHPCYTAEARRTYARIHLAVAPKCNAQCIYCDRTGDCPNESRPGLASQVLSPLLAIRYFDAACARDPSLSVAGIAGPGDPLANPEETFATLAGIRDVRPEAVLCLSTNGLALPEHLGAIARCGVSHVTVTVNAVDPVVGAKLYTWVRRKKRVYRGIEAGEAILEAQMKGIEGLKDLGIAVKVNTVVVPGINDTQTEAIARIARSWGVDRYNLIAVKPAPAAPQAGLEQPDVKLMHRLRAAAARHVPLMEHCSRCRADAAGKLGSKKNPYSDILKKITEPDRKRTRVAVATREGMLVNQHLGEASELWIFEILDGQAHVVESRPTSPKGQGDQRWEKLALSLHDCHSLLVAGVGPTPSLIMRNHGIQVVEMSGLVEEGLDHVYRGVPLRSAIPVERRGCGSCSGGGGGCG